MTTREDLLVAAGPSVGPGRWLGVLDELMARSGSRFWRVEPRRRARAFVLGLLAELPRKNCWTIAGHAGDRTPDGMQHLLSRARHRGCTRRNRLPVRVSSSSSAPSHRPGSTLGPAATRRSSRVVTNRDDQTVAAPGSSTDTPKITRYRWPITRRMNATRRGLVGRVR